MSGTVYARKIIQWQAQEYTVILYYFALPSVEVAINRVKHHVAQGGHHIPEHDIRRRYKRSLENLEKRYKLIVDKWGVINTSSSQPVLIQQMQELDTDYYMKIAMQAARRAAREVIQQAHKDNTPLPIWKNGRVEYSLPELDPRDD